MDKIHLPSTKTIISTTFSHESRNRDVSKMLDDLHFSNVEWSYGEVGSPYWQFVSNQIFQIFDTHTCPFLLLENDATLIPENYCDTIYDIRDVDVLYLGGTTISFEHMARKLQRNKRRLFVNKNKGHSYFPDRMPYRRHDEQFNRLLYREHSSQFIEPFAMICGHAILFLNECAKEGFKTIITKNNDLPYDNLFAEEMNRWNTLLVKKPFWYQNDGRNNAKTRCYYVE